MYTLRRVETGRGGEGRGGEGRERGEMGGEGEMRGTCSLVFISMK